MPLAALAQRTFFEDASCIALRLPLGPVLGGLHPGGVFPLVEDPRAGDRACIVGMMVLRAATSPWQPATLEQDLPGALRDACDWCFDVAGVGGSWPISGGNALDAYRLALQYGTVDAVMAGASTIAREGVTRGTRRGHLWQPYAPLSWPPFRAHRGELESAIAALRVEWQQMGILSPRRYPAQIVITRGGASDAGPSDFFGARIFHDRHPDGSPIETWVLTSEAGEECLRESAAWKQYGLGDRVLVCSPPDQPTRIDAARVPALLRRRLDARLVQHDGGAMSLAAFLDAGGVAQLQLTLLRGRSVKDVLTDSDRIDGGEKQRLLSSWKERPRRFPSGGQSFPSDWRPFYGVMEDRSGSEAVIVSLDVRPR